MTKHVIQFFDTTLRDGEQTIGVNFTVDDKIEIAKRIADWGADVIEAGFPVASPADLAAVRRIGQEVTNANIVGLARCVKKDIDAVTEALGDAPNGQIHVFIATSPIHRDSKLHMTKDQVMDRINECVSYAKQTFENVEFSPEDATRTEWDFLAQAVQVAIEAGATVINIPDTTGYTTPVEMANLFQYLRQNVADFDKVIFSAHCHNDLGMATANALAAVENGASRIEGTINGIGERAGNTALEQIVAIMNARQDHYSDYTTNVDMTKTYDLAQFISEKSGIALPNNQPLTGSNAFAHESGIHQDGFLKNPSTYEILTPESVGRTRSTLPLGKLSGSHAVVNRLEQIGFRVKKEEVPVIFRHFQAIADQSRLVSNEQLRQMMSEISEIQVAN